MKAIKLTPDSQPQTDAALIQNLQLECEQLRQALDQCEIQRDAYRSLYIDELRSSREFEDLDIPTLEAMSAGPVELIEEA